MSAKFPLKIMLPPIEHITDTEIAFYYLAASYSITGIIDRVTGKTSIEKLYEGNVGSILMMLTRRPATPPSSSSQTTRVLVAAPA
jgi:hypothetical protein